VSVASSALGRGTKTLLLGRKGTENAFKNADLAHYKKIHLAVHGTTDPAFPDRAALILLSDPSAGEDGFLQASEIAQLRLNADLVVLSACDTAVGPLQGQEGIAALSRAFLMAGTRTVVSTLWKIDDNASLFVMRRFYARLAAGTSAGEALRRAKLDFIKSLGANALPYYWAGYTLEGAVGQDSRSGGKSGRASE
jgi:CHAT domain-containing protein